MVGLRDTLGRLWFLVVVLLVASNLILLSLHLSAADASSVGASKQLQFMPQSPEAFTGRLAAASMELGDGAEAVGYAFTKQAQSLAATTGKTAASAGTAVKNGTTAVSQGIVSGISSAAYGVSHIAKFASSTTTVGDLIKPADKTPSPVITPAAAVASITQVASSVLAPPPTDTPVQWPIRGSVTTQFGAPHSPFQRVHSGLDISDGRPAGVTPVKSFKPGRVAEVVRSGYGLGNHVIVDHGESLTSVYGHLSSVTVQTGQQVDQNTVLGHEGSTGASTGTHLHFEIRMNGQPVDPRKFIEGSP